MNEPSPPTVAAAAAAATAAIDAVMDAPTPELLKPPAPHIPRVPRLHQQPKITVIENSATSVEDDTIFSVKSSFSESKVICAKFHNNKFGGEEEKVAGKEVNGKEKEKEKEKEVNDKEEEEGKRGKKKKRIRNKRPLTKSLSTEFSHDKRMQLNASRIASTALSKTQKWHCSTGWTDTNLDGPDSLKREGGKKKTATDDQNRDDDGGCIDRTLAVRKHPVLKKFASDSSVLTPELTRQDACRDDDAAFAVEPKRPGRVSRHNSTSSGVTMTLVPPPSPNLTVSLSVATGISAKRAFAALTAPPKRKPIGAPVDKLETVGWMEIREATRRDNQLQQLIDVYENHFDHMPMSAVPQYYRQHRYSLRVYDRVLLFDNRPVIPELLRAPLLEMLYAVCSCEGQFRGAAAHVFWLGISAEVNVCCRRYPKPTPRVVALERPLPKRTEVQVRFPFQHVHLTLFRLRKRTFVVLIDELSK